VIIPNVIVAAGYLEQLVDELVAIAIVSAYYIYIYIYICTETAQFIILLTHIITDNNDTSPLSDLMHHINASHQHICL